MVFSKKILIVEDEIIISDFIFKMLNNSGFTNVKVANNSEDALFIINNFKPEILLLDINVEGKDSGIELAKKKNIEAKVIYITAQNDNATIQKAIATNPITYLTKPLKKTDLLAAIQLASFRTKTQSILIKDGFEEIKLSLDDLLFIKSDGNYIDIYTNTRKISIRESLEKFYEKLDENQFLRIHRSIIINQNKISKKTATSVFINTTELPISRNYKKNIKM